MGRLAYAREVCTRMVVGVYSDGFIHAGNLAYLSLLALFPFFIVAATIARIFGQTEVGIEAVNGFLMAVPPSVAEALREPIRAVLTERSTGGIFWLGLVVGLWTVASLIETIRDILRRAYGTKSSKSFWHYRLHSIGFIVLSVIAMMFAFSLQVIIAAVEEFLRRVLPFADVAIQIAATSRLMPMLIVSPAVYVLFLLLTPDAYRGRAYPKWPGALLTAIWWYAILLLLPLALAHLIPTNMTYGSLAGTMIALIFFFLVGLGVVIGAELNAALTDFPDETAPETDTKLEAA